jgi:hypothetical protein
MHIFLQILFLSDFYYASKRNASRRNCHKPTKIFAAIEKQVIKNQSVKSLKPAPFSIQKSKKP